MPSRNPREALANNFFSERMECFDCHAGFNLSGTVNFVGKSIENAQFENNGLYNIDARALIRPTTPACSK
ncbi:MAG: hypothetical protein IPJ30_15215 [Acidobacteria bacterium]|nr:hypothetical protein [Acidobacteriota bacterium]